MRLLVVEDDATIARPLLSGLQREGYDVQLAASGTAALAAEDYDLVLLDLGLPDIDGRDVCSRLRKLWRYRSSWSLRAATRSTA